jgi:hypothetical protein
MRRAVVLALLLLAAPASAHAGPLGPARHAMALG